MSPEETCPDCGGPLDGRRCPSCRTPAADTAASERLIHREIVLLVVLVVIAVGGFLLTRKLALYNRTLQAGDATEWYERGRRELEAGRIADAVTDLRRAAAMDPEHAPYRVSLARALGADARDDEARQILLTVRERQPEDPDTNLQLARLEVRTGNTDAAVRYYQGALAALWAPQDAEARRQTRSELIAYLLGQQRRARALSEILVLNADLPDAAEAQIAVGRMFLDAGDPRRAADRFAQVLARDPANAAALAGAGAAAFALGRYQPALRYLAGAPGGMKDVADMRAVARFVLDRDPLAVRLGAAERSRRLTMSLTDLTNEIDSCLSRQTDPPGAIETLQRLRAELAALTPVAAGRAPAPRPATRDDLEEGLDLLLRAVRAASSAGCSPQPPLDRALELIAAQHAIEGP